MFKNINKVQSIYCFTIAGTPVKCMCAPRKGVDASATLLLGKFMMDDSDYVYH